MARPFLRGSTSRSLWSCWGHRMNARRCVWRSLQGGKLSLGPSEFPGLPLTTPSVPCVQVHLSTHQVFPESTQRSRCRVYSWEPMARSPPQAADLRCRAGTGFAYSRLGGCVVSVAAVQLQTWLHKGCGRASAQTRRGPSQRVLVPAPGTKMGEDFLWPRSAKWVFLMSVQNIRTLEADVRAPCPSLCHLVLPERSE